MAVEQYNTNPDLNLTINGVNIAEFCPSRNINDGLRHTHADIASWRDFLYNVATSPFLLRTGAQTINGDINFNGALTAGAATVSGNLRAGTVFFNPTDGSYYGTFLGPVPILNWDANDYDAFDRGNNSRNFYIAGVNRVAISSGGLTVAGGLTVSGNIASAGAQFANNGNVQFGGVTAMTGNASDITCQSGSSQWRVVNQAFNLELLKVDNATGGLRTLGAIYPTNDSSFYLTKAGPNPAINWDANDYTYFDRTTNDHAWVVAGSVYMSLGSTSGGLAVNVAIKRDPNFYMDFGGGQPLINFDANDYLQFDRGINLYRFSSGGSDRMTINSGGGVVATAFTPTSDARLKTEIEDLDREEMLAAVRAIGGKRYLKNGEYREIGCLAQDVQGTALADLVGVGPDGMLNLNYNGGIAAHNVLVAWLFERLEAAESRIQQLEAA